MLMGGGGFRLGKVENAGIEGIAYYDGQFKTGIPEGRGGHDFINR